MHLMINYWIILFKFWETISLFDCLGNANFSSHRSEKMKQLNPQKIHSALTSEKLSPTEWSFDFRWPSHGEHRKTFRDIRINTPFSELRNVLVVETIHYFPNVILWFLNYFDRDQNFAITKTYFFAWIDNSSFIDFNEMEFLI